jgi:hypothetical protein
MSIQVTRIADFHSFFAISIQNVAINNGVLYMNATQDFEASGKTTFQNSSQRNQCVISAHRSFHRLQLVYFGSDRHNHDAVRGCSMQSKKPGRGGA